MKTALVFFAAALMAHANAAEWQSLDSIRAAAEQYVLSDRPNPGLEVQAGVLDPRLRLPACDGALQSFRASGGTKNRNVTIGVRCSGTRSWKLYVPVRVIQRAPVLVARHALPRGQVVSMDDLEWTEQDLNTLPYGFIDRPEQINGLELKRPLSPGTVLIPAMFSRQQLIRRGQQVRLVTRTGGIEISMGGTALMDGALQQRIRVANSSSGRVVEGIVLSQETVQIGRP